MARVRNVDNRRCDDCRHLYHNSFGRWWRCTLKPKLLMTGKDGWCAQLEEKDRTEERILKRNW